MANGDDTSSGLLGAAAPTATSTIGGLMGLDDPSLLMHIGFGLMASSRYGGNAGEGLLQGLQSYQGMKSSQLQQKLGQQQLQLGQQQLQGGALDLQQRQAYAQAAAAAAKRLAQRQSGGGLMGGNPDPSAGAPAPSTPFMPGISPMPATPMQQPTGPTMAPQGLPASLQAPSQEQIYGTTYPGGLDPAFAQLAAYRPGADPNAEISKFRADQLKLAQQHYAPAIAKLDTLIHSDTPSKYMKADPDLQGAWPQLAQTLGMDPDKDYNDPNVRTALSYVRNQMAGALQEPTEAPMNRVRTTQLPDGRIVQEDPVTGKQTVEAPSPLEKVIGANGKPTLVPAGKAAGMTPFSPPLMGVANMTDAGREQAYQYYLLHQALPPGFARSPAAVSDMWNYISQRANQDGNSQASIYATSQQLKARQGAEKSFAPGGKDYQTVQFLNTAVAHLDTMQNLAQALNNNVPSQTLNRFKNAVSAEFGGTAPTSAAAASQIVGSEVTKAIVANGGSAGERDEAAKAFSTAKTWPQLQTTIDTYKQLLGGQLETRRNSYQQTFGRTDFDQRFLTPQTRKALGIAEPEPVGAAGGNVPTLTPEQARSTPKGTRFKTTDGRVMVRQ